MIKISNTIVIQKPVNEVFDYVSDFENTPMWNDYVIQVKNLSDNKLGKGTVYQQTRKTDQQKFEVLEYIPYRKVRVQTLPGATPEFRIECQFIGNSQETEFIYMCEMKLPNSDRWGVLDKLAENGYRLAMRQNLWNLKRLLESGNAEFKNRHLSTI